MLEGAKRILAHKVAKKEPITPQIFKSLVDRFALADASLCDIRTICMLGFTGFLRYSELANLKEADVTFYSDHMELFIESSNTDQYRDRWLCCGYCSDGY